MIAIAIQKPGDGRVDAVVENSFYKAFLAVTNIVFAYGILKSLLEEQNQS